MTITPQSNLGNFPNSVFHEKNVKNSNGWIKAKHFVKALFIGVLLLAANSLSAQNTALSTTGLNNELNITYNLPTGDGFEIQAWIYIPSLTAPTSLISQTSGSIAAPLDFQLNTDGSLTLSISDRSSFQSNTTAIGLISAGTLHHVAVGFEGDFDGVDDLDNIAD